MRLTHGCIRLYPDDIASLYKQLPIGSTVKIEHEPVKVGWYAGKLYIEIYQPSSEMQISDSHLHNMAMNLVSKALDERPVTTGFSSKIRQAVKNKSGIPVAPCSLFKSLLVAHHVDTDSTKNAVNTVLVLILQLKKHIPHSTLN